VILQSGGRREGLCPPDALDGVRFGVRWTGSKRLQIRLIPSNTSCCLKTKEPRDNRGSFKNLHWLRGRDLNPRPLGYEPNELPDCSTPRHEDFLPLRAGGGAEGRAIIVDSPMCVKVLLNARFVVRIPSLRDGSDARPEGSPRRGPFTRARASRAAAREDAGTPRAGRSYCSCSSFWREAYLGRSSSSRYLRATASASSER
jgi:hypothetical protein